LEFTVFQGNFNDDVTYFDQSGLVEMGTGSVTSIPDIFVGTGSLIPVKSQVGQYSVQWLGSFRTPVTGSYTFYVNSDDASYPWIGPSATQGYTTDLSVHGAN